MWIIQRELERGDRADVVAHEVHAVKPECVEQRDGVLGAAGPGERTGGKLASSFTSQIRSDRPISG